MYKKVNVILESKGFEVESEFNKNYDCIEHCVLEDGVFKVRILEDEENDILKIYNDNSEIVLYSPNVNEIVENVIVSINNDSYFRNK